MNKGSKHTQFARDKMSKAKLGKRLLIFIKRISEKPLKGVGQIQYLIKECQIHA